MRNEKRNINIGFIINYRLDGWLGVTNYYLNLFNTIKLFSDKRSDKIKIVIITDNYITTKEKLYFKNFRIIKTQNVSRKNRFIKLFNLFQIIFFGKNFIFEKFLIKNKIDIISHTSFLGKNSKIPSLKWFPDFQEIHFPENFSLKQKIARKIDIILSKIHSTKILISSKSVLKDLKKINIDAYKKSLILYHYNLVKIKKIKNNKVIEKNYNTDLPKKYIYLPNHYWKHKNHITVFKSIDYLNKKYNKKVYLVTTGNKNDYRFPEYKSYLDEFLEKNKIKNQVLHLGIVKKDEVYSLIRNSFCMINPSLSEGWGNSIDYALIFKKMILLSNIPVHLEQNPSNGIFFKTKKYKDLAKKILFLYDKKNTKKKLFIKGKNNSLEFYKNYCKIIYSFF